MVKLKTITIIFVILLIVVMSSATSISYIYSNYSRQKIALYQTSNLTISTTNNPVITIQPNPTVSTTVTPKPSILRVISPTNSTYSTNTVELTYTIDSKVVWSYYGLDIGGNGAGSKEYVGINELFTLHGLVPFKGNITLNLPEGMHRLLLAVQTEESRFSNAPIAYETIFFIIA